MEPNELLQQLMAERSDLSLANIAKAIGLSNSAVQKWVTGSTKSMRTVNMEKIAKHVGVSLEWLLYGDEGDRAN